MVVESHVTLQSHTQGPADQKPRGFCLRDWVLCAGYQCQSTDFFFFQVHTKQCGLGAGALA